jgi:predicted lactoylglutathione lyase
MSRTIFINLPVTDLERSKAFYAALGARNEPGFSNESAAMMKFSDEIAVMLLTHDFYRTFTTKPIADANATSQVLLCVSCDGRAQVDRMVEAAAAHGGQADPGPKQEMGDFMYGRSFADPDGHHWEPMWMDASAAEQGAHAAGPVKA